MIMADKEGRSVSAVPLQPAAPALGRSAYRLLSLTVRDAFGDVVRAGAPFPLSRTGLPRAARWPGHLGRPAVREKGQPRRVCVRLCALSAVYSPDGPNWQVKQGRTMTAVDGAGRCNKQVGPQQRPSAGARAWNRAQSSTVSCFGQVAPGRPPWHLFRRSPHLPLMTSCFRPAECIWHSMALSKTGNLGAGQSEGGQVWNWSSRGCFR